MDTRNDPIARFDDWLRSDFVRLNTELEEVYFAARTDVISGRPNVDAAKRALLEQGGPLIEQIAAMPAPPSDSRASYRLLGLIGHYLAACERHEAPLSEHAGGQRAAWQISQTIGQSLGVTPRFVFAHQSLFNDAIAGKFHTFTSLPDEEVFIRFNALGVLAYRRAADALREIPEIGVSNPVSAYLFDLAHSALADVLRFNQDLARQLNVDRFFFNIRPYFKSYRVGDTMYRGANAGDFAAINEIDVLVGVCRMDDPFYQAVVREKAAHVPPDDQPFMKNLPNRRSLLDLFLDELDATGATPEWRTSAARYLDVWKAHAAAYAFHHQRLIKGFLEQPAKTAASSHGGGVTSSGPPLDQVIDMLQRLTDLRSARERPGLTTAAASLARLRAALG